VPRDAAPAAGTREEAARADICGCVKVCSVHMHVCRTTHTSIQRTHIYFTAPLHRAMDELWRNPVVTEARLKALIVRCEQLGAPLRTAGALHRADEWKHWPTLMRVIVGVRISHPVACALWAKLRRHAWQHAGGNPDTEPRLRHRVDHKELQTLMLCLAQHMGTPRIASLSKSCTRALCELAVAWQTRAISLGAIAQLVPTAAKQELCKLRGVGPWVFGKWYELHGAPVHADSLWTRGDVAIRNAATVLLGIPQKEVDEWGARSAVVGRLGRVRVMAALERYANENRLRKPRCATVSLQ